MARSMRCKLSGCDLDDCGVCRRCGDASKERHQWGAAESDDPCYRREVCQRCRRERRQPDHDWQSSPSKGADGVTLRCSRCGLTI
jgi:predicted Fe-S protein YdhL (DUF1289 family)